MIALFGLLELTAAGYEFLWGFWLFFPSFFSWKVVLEKKEEKEMKLIMQP